MIQHNKHLLVRVGEDHYDFRFEKSELYGTWVLVYKSPFIWQKYGKEMWNWKVQLKEKPIPVGLASELSEEQWREIVTQVPCVTMADNTIWLYNDYERIGNAYDTATESGMSLLKSRNLTSTTVYVLKLNEK